MSQERADPELQGLLSPDKPDMGTHPAPCPVVGLGASAGGLEAFQSFLAATPADGGAAYVLVQHLDPNHESMLAELLARRTSMTVQQAADGMAVEPNNVYLIPPNASLVIERARLRLSHFAEPRGFRRPIDTFFRSLALDQGPNAACVVLSGTGGDGSEGLRAVKEAGGLTLVQMPDSAKYDGMPKSAVATRCVDRVLDVPDMPAALRDYFDRGQSPVLSLPDVTDFLQQVCEEVRKRIGHDFSQYKRTTMLRRIQRRMQVVGAATATEYLTRLRGDGGEADLLFRDLLINVTCFFRDSEVFDFVRREVIPGLLADKGAADTVRVWIPGCSSGEEAYSFAILLVEAAASSRSAPAIQIFATDIDKDALDKGRAGAYPVSAVKDLPPGLLDRYFFAQDDTFVVTQAIRDLVRFSDHDLIKDPPFSRVDLITCRNLLIYLNTSLQQRLIPVFHYALKPGGWLLLGSAENIAARGDLFDTVNPSARVYRRRGGHRQAVSMPLFVPPLAAPWPTAAAGGPNGRAERSDPVARRVLERYAPPHVVVSADGRILRASTRTGRFLELAEGTPSTRVSDLARRGLRSAIRIALERARSARKRAIVRDVRVESGDETALRVDLVADPLSDDETLLVFQESAASPADADDSAEVRVDGSSDEDRIKQLEDEVDETRSRLRTTIEELETSNEELKSSNEEMMSMNEELQSTNEELATVNEELKNKVDQLARANSDLQNFIESTQVPTIFLDKRMRIRSFTPATRTLFRFQEQDRGRPFSDMVSRVDSRRIEQLGKQVLASGQPAEIELRLENPDESYVLRVLPYLDLNGAMDGVVMVFTDVTKVRQAQADAERTEGLARQRGLEIERLYDTAPVGMALVDRNRRLIKLNRQFADGSGHGGEDRVGRPLDEVLPSLAASMERPIAEVLERGHAVVNFEAAAPRGDDGVRDYLLDFYPYEEVGRVIAVGVILKDVTEPRRLERELRRLMLELQHRVKNTLATVTSIMNQTVASKPDRADLVETLKKRVGSLAATHDLLTSQDWRDASLRDIIDAELGPFDHRERITLSGPDVRLPPKHALTLTLTLHELATNAAKYGALAHAGARLSLDWMVSVDAAGRRLTLNWIESGVPGIGAKPAKESFGTRVIRSGVVHDLRGTCDYRLRPGGLVCAIVTPY